MTKETERTELHRTIWRIANDLRGSVDGWDFKAYVLGMLFYRFISENLTAYLNEQERATGNPDFDYRHLPNADAEFGRDETVKEKGFYILPQDLFANVRERARHDDNLNETLARVFRNIEASSIGANSEDDFKGLFDDLDVNSTKLGATVAKRNEKLVKLLDAIGDLRLGHNGNTIDAFGDAYEYLMGMYAANAGRSGGEYYTPQEVSELLARITVVGKTEVNKVYDPACGSGSLLLKFDKVLGHENVRQGYFGQEINLATYNLCRINMFLHDINYEKFDIAHGDTLTDPVHWDDEPFEAIVSNPPYSTRWAGDADPLLINDPRFAPAGVLAPKSKADLAFTMHILSWLAVNGTAAIVESQGCSTEAGRSRRSANTSSTTIMSTRSSSSRPTSFSVRRSQPASSCLRSPRLTTKSCSLTPRPNSSARAIRTSSAPTTSKPSLAPSPSARTSPISPHLSTPPRSPRTTSTSPSAPTSRARTLARSLTSRSSTPRSPASSRGRPSFAPRSTRSSPT
jgi:type I restriction enzyme M protein